VLGAERLRAEGLEQYANVCERHTGAGITREEILREGLPLPPRDLIPLSWEEKIICFADKFFSKSRPGRELSLGEIRASLARYGEGPLARWDEMVEWFYE
jgi:uncharacterized protein